MKCFHPGRGLRGVARIPRLLLAFLCLLPAAVLRAQLERPALNNAVSAGRIFGYLQILRLAGVSVESLTARDVTLILPVDTTFYELEPEAYARIFSPENQALALKYVQSHLLKGKHTLEDLAEGNYQTEGGIALRVTPATPGHPATINGCPVVGTEIVGSRGAVLLISGWLFRP